MSKKRTTVVLCFIFTLAMSMAETKLSAGQFVAARWSDGNYYLAKINAIKGDNCTVRWEGGGDEEIVDKEDIIALPDKPSFKVGDKVFAVWPDEYLRFYSGIVQKVEAKACIIKWNDGSSPSSVAMNRIMPASSGMTETIEYTLWKNGSIVGSIDSDGLVRLGGSIVGEFESDGTVRKNGSIVGSLEKNGNIRKSGSIVGSVDKSGTVRKGGSIYGSIEDDGTIYEGGSIIGEVEEGIPKQQVAAYFFFFFLE